MGPVAEGVFDGICEGLFQNKVLHNCQSGGCLFPVGALEQAPTIVHLRACARCSSCYGMRAKGM